MDSQNTPYQPIDCNYYDRLEAWATLREPVLLEFLGDDGQPRTETAVIRDLYVRNKAEFLLTEAGRELRLDRLMAVNHLPVPKTC
ncbi:hypothetical protein [Chitinophaga sp.]|uniref:hypothetical protein n=1 Tax=Chitinophaga sp. TaxID=1869181 RepID=UPI00263346D5|nr:hypothetical protein [uncultured Chitinophaga sp.]